MAQTICPICGTRNYGHLGRCQSCGADFHDPDVRAMMEAGGSDLPALDDLAAENDTVAASKVLGVEAESLDRGSALRKLAILGAGLCAVGFLLPVAQDYRHYAFPWELSSPPLALWLIALASVAGIAIAMAPMPTRIRGGALGVLGLVGLVMLPSLGRYGAASSALTPVLSIGLAVAGAGAIQRLYRPREMLPRYALAAGAALVVIGMLIPVGSPIDLMSAEMRFGLRGEPESSMPLFAWWGAVRQSHLTFFIGLFAVAPIVIAPAAAGLAWPIPGVWDHFGLGLRPLTWLLVLFPAISMALLTFNMMGWDDIGRVVYDDYVIRGTDFTQAGMVGRVKVMLPSAAFGLWASFGMVAAYRAARPDSAA